MPARSWPTQGPAFRKLTASRELVHPGCTAVDRVWDWVATAERLCRSICVRPSESGGCVDTTTDRFAHAASCARRRPLVR